MKKPLLLYLIIAPLFFSACGGGSSSSSSSNAGNFPPNSTPPSLPDSVRFLEQSSFGPTEDSIAAVRQKGFESFLDEQFSIKAQGYTNLPNALSPVDIVGEQLANCKYDGVEASAASQCYRDNFSIFTMQTRFFQNALTQPDQLRQRVAWALSQILVVSGKVVFQAQPMQAYQSILYDNAFGNYRDILYKVTLSPVMGSYLNMVNNSKPSGNQKPNENYARELLQLFSIGKVKLNPDGSPVMQGGVPVPTYSQTEIEGFAYVFTGWTYPTLPGKQSKFYSPFYYVGDMAVVPAEHATTAKTLLNGVTLPANQTPEKDLNDAIDNVFNHPNVGPFIGKLLIQQLVTSNPSAEYVARVSAVFNNNGQGIRGDLKAVVRAILLDAEARGDNKTDALYGHLKEPALYLLNVLRAAGAKSDGAVLRYFLTVMDQDIFVAPSVFNYYPPDFSLASEKISAPEFAIHNTSTALERTNLVHGLVFYRPGSYDPVKNEYINPLAENITGVYKDASINQSIGTLIDWSAWQALAADTPALLEKINSLMFHGTMSGPMRDSITKAINAISADDKLQRAQTAFFLAVTSPAYLVER
jgi:uncharacterized protein (DUF1800 family)